MRYQIHQSHFELCDKILCWRANITLGEGDVPYDVKVEQINVEQNGNAECVE